GIKAEFELIQGPRAASISEQGLLQWTPTDGDRGTQKFKVKITTNGNDVVFHRYSTTVTTPLNVAAPTKSAPEMRIWTDDSKTFQMEAEFVRIEGDKVHLKDKSGNSVTVPIDKLSPADREYLKQQ